MLQYNMENTNEKIVLKTSESQRAANKKYRDKMKSNEEYKSKQKVRMLTLKKVNL